MEKPFTDEEWAQLRALPFVIFTRVASADGVLQNEEAGRFVEQLRASAFCADPLRRELSQQILAADFMGLFLRSKDASRWNADVEAARKILRAKLDDATYRAFVGALLMSALEVAQVADKGPGRQAQTPEEESALIDLAHRLGIEAADLDALRRNPGC